MRLGWRHGWRGLMALVLSLAVVAAQAVAQPGPMPFDPSLLLDPAAVCHADPDTGDLDAAHVCCVACQAPAAQIATPPALAGAAPRWPAPLRPDSEAPPTPQAPPAAHPPRGPPLSV